jgi:hypothetical protein
MQRNQQEPVAFAFQSETIDEFTLDLSVERVAQMRFLRNPHRYIREFLERNGQEVNDVSFAVSEDGATLEECLAAFAIAAARPKGIHLKSPQYKSRWVVT